MDYNNLNYHQKKNIDYTLRLRNILATLPSFAKDFFRSIEPNTSAKTRISYAYDIRVFFEFLVNNNSCININGTNTNINFPVVQAKDNKFYLKKNFKKEYNSAGWIFADYRNSFENLDQNTIVYGHNRRNGTMFSNLKKFLDASFAQKPSSMYFSSNTPKQRYIAKIYSVYKISSTKLTLANNFENSEEYQKFIDEVKSRSQYEYTTEVYTSDKTLTLCTCDDNTAYRIAIHAKLIPIDNENDDNSNESNEAEDEDNDNTDNNNNNNQ